MSGSSAVIVWRRFNGANTIVQASRSTDAGQTWSTPVDLSAPGQGAISPRVALAGSAAVVIWRRSDGANFIAQASRSTDAGQSWSTPVDLSAPGRDVTAPQVATNGSTAVGTWYRSNGTSMIVQSTRSSDGGLTWEAPVDLSAPGQNAFYPQVAVSRSTAVVAWYRSNGSTYIVQAARLAIPEGAAQGSTSRSTFRFVLPDGRECTSISPQAVVNGTDVVLPDADADCRTPGALLTGWRIPGQDWAFRPAHTVHVVDSQVFTAILREPVVHVILDANVDDSDTCLDPAGRPATVRTSDLFLQRPGMTVPGRALQPSITTFPAPTAAPCTSPGHTLTGWSTRGNGSGPVTRPGGTLDRVLGTDENVVRLFSVWSATPRRSISTR